MSVEAERPNFLVPNDLHRPRSDESFSSFSLSAVEGVAGASSTASPSEGPDEIGLFGVALFPVEK